MSTIMGDRREDSSMEDGPTVRDDPDGADPVDEVNGSADDAPPGDARVADDRVRLREVVLLVVAVLGIVGTVFFGLRWRELHDQEQRRDEVQDAASAFLTALFEWDGTTIDEDFDRILTYATGDFEQEAQSTFNDDEIRQSLRENRAGSRMDELDTFVRSIGDDQARVFAVVDQTAANAEFPEGRSDTVRIEIGLQREGGDWKVFDVNVLDGLSLGLPTQPPAGE